MRTTKNSGALSESAVIDLYMDLATSFGGVIAASKVRIPDRVVWELVGALSRVFDSQWRRAAARGHLATQPRPAIAAFLKMLRSLEARLHEDLDDY